jgi:hypothetical protein
MKNIYRPRNEAELAMIKSLLVSENIPFTVMNDGFGSLEAGPQIGLFNERIVQVPEDHAERAAEIIADFTAATAADVAVEHYSLLDKIRMTAEALVFQWIMPGRRRKRSYRGTDLDGGQEK